MRPAEARGYSMDEIVAVLSMFQNAVGAFAGFGVDNSYSVASFCLVIALAIFGAVCLSHLAERRDILHLGFNMTAMFAGGVIGNAMLRGAYMPLGNDLLITATLALLGMSVMALVLLVTYIKTEI
jgi:hypothetical protein